MSELPKEIEDVAREAGKHIEEGSGSLGPHNGESLLVGVRWLWNYLSKEADEAPKIEGFDQMACDMACIKLKIKFDFSPFIWFREGARWMFSNDSRVESLEREVATFRRAIEGHRAGQGMDVYIVEANRIRDERNKV